MTGPEASTSPLDRDFQRRLLLAMRDVYPSPLPRSADFTGAPRDPYVISLSYLEGHGLCTHSLMRLAGANFVWGRPTITAAGLDFLEDDGGLTAILGVVTVRIHADSVRDLLNAKIDEAPIPAEQKRGLKEHLKRLSSMALQEISKELIQEGVRRLPDVVSMLGKFAGP